MHRLYNLFSNVEMPIVRITGDMELTGVCVDQSLGARLKDKYNIKLEKLDTEIENKLNDLSELILNWRQSPEANAYPRQYQPKKSKKSRAELEEEFPYTDAKTGKRYKISKKCLKDQLDNPIKLSSSQQMAILFYDILGIPSFDKKSARTTGEEAIERFKEVLEAMALAADTWENPDIQPTAEDYAKMAKNAKPYYSAAELCDLLLKRRGIVKLITTYIDTIPTLVKHWPDGRIRFHLNSLGTDTGRYSSGGKLKFMEGEEPIEVSGINIQNIPSHCKEIRMLFKAACEEKEQEMVDNSIEIEEYLEVETPDGWKYPRDLKINDMITTDDSNALIKSIVFNNSKKTYRIEV
jgi:DNA polymerase I-like protein with 3'-5' exonuclease and polymerase domains